MHAAGSEPYDALLVLSFGGPERPEDVLPFLENVTRGRNVPRERLLEVAEHYHHFGGKSPINDQNRALIDALAAEFSTMARRLPIYFGNRNWHPFLTDTVRQMSEDGVRRALVLFTSAFSSYSGCRQYRENIESAQRDVGTAAPRSTDCGCSSTIRCSSRPWSSGCRRRSTRFPRNGCQRAFLIFTAHSIPLGMAQNCQYEAQLREACGLVAASFPGHAWQLAFQSRSGPPSQPWLEPDILDALAERAQQQTKDVVVVPIGFVSDHLEVLYDLDFEAQQLSDSLGLNMVRAGTAGTAPKFVAMIRELVLERIEPGQPRRALGTFGASHDVCPVDCCLPAKR